jgi:hypothetical protein
MGRDSGSEDSLRKWIRCEKSETIRAGEKEMRDDCSIGTARAGSVYRVRCVGKARSKQIRRWRGRPKGERSLESLCKPGNLSL